MITFRPAWACPAAVAWCTHGAVTPARLRAVASAGGTQSGHTPSSPDRPGISSTCVSRPDRAPSARIRWIVSVLEATVLEAPVLEATAPGAAVAVAAAPSAAASGVASGASVPPAASVAPGGARGVTTVIALQSVTGGKVLRSVIWYRHDLRA